MKSALLIPAAVLALAGCSKPAPQPAAATAPASAESFPAPSVKDVPAGEYKTDPMHSSLTFKVFHMGFSHYTARFGKFDATLQLDPAHPEAARLTATVDPQSLELNSPPKGFHDDLMGQTWFDAKAHPQMTFTSTKIEKTGDNTAKVTGDLSLKGVTKPVTLDVVFNGGYPGMQMDPHARIGFTATGTLNRADFGMGFGIPAPGSSMGVGGLVDFTIDTEMTGPALKTGG
ncbi:YceI family protein [Asticcacaulis solisilvae]|uniref:YceI family protein n=1 Tax=Asticcacaulis solisilvae TaxID=1217274 RepID=UPI003FD8005E